MMRTLYYQEAFDTRVRLMTYKFLSLGEFICYTSITIMMKKTAYLLLNALPVIVMIGLIPLVGNDYILTIIYTVIIIAALAIKHEKNDLIVMIFGFIIMIVSEWLFISTGVETFQRNTLFGIMPLWLPFLWAYGFVAIKRLVEILNK